jgi:hypothetical protein
MELTDQDIREFIAVWEAEFSELLTVEEARLHASLLLRLYFHLVEPHSNPLTTNRQDSHAVL